MSRPDSQPVSLPWLITALLFWLANVLMHLRFSNWLVSPHNTPWGSVVPRDLSPWVAGAVAVLVVLWVGKCLMHAQKREVHTVAWTIWAVAAGIAFFTLMTTPIEAIHYLQYAMISYLLALAIDRHKHHWPLLTILFMTTGLGIVDEMNQFFLLTPGNSTYVDFNDFVLNELGAIAGLLAFYLGLGNEQDSRYWPLSPVAGVTATGYVLAILVVLGLFMLGRLVHTPDGQVPPGGILAVDGRWTIFLEREPGLLGSWQTSFGDGQYYVLGVLGGVFTILVLAALVAIFRKQLTNTSA